MSDLIERLIIDAACLRKMVDHAKLAGPETDVRVKSPGLLLDSLSGAADRITALEKENAELRQLADDRLNDAARLTNEKTDYWLRIHAMEKALSFILSLEISPASNEHSGAENGKQLLRARSAVRQAITMEDIHREQLASARPRIKPSEAEGREAE